MDPYSGENVHHPPLILAIFYPFQQHQHLIPLFFVVLDVFGAFILRASAAVVCSKPQLKKTLPQFQYLPDLIFAL
jgi:hypothetical protein